jgi:hypothetical protein
MTRSSKKRLLLSCLLFPGFLCVGGCNSSPTEISLVNAGFEEAGDAQAPVPGWRLNQHAGAPAYEMSIDTKTVASGRASFRMHRLTPQFYGSIAQQATLPKGLGGRSAVLTARMKTQDVGRKGWVLVMTITAGDGNHQVRAEPLRGTNEFTTVTLRAKLPDDVQAIEVSALLLDEGTAWLDDVRLRVEAN